MKIDNASGPSHLLYKGPIENSERYTQGKEVERVQAANATPSTASAFMDNRIQGSVFDAKA
jgi:hypothetical protein